MALVKYNDNSISAISSAGQLATGGLVPIKTLTASNSASLSFVDGSNDVVLDSTYPIYRFEFINVHGSANANFEFQGSTNGGSSYGVTVTSSMFQVWHNEAGNDASLTYFTTGDLAQSTSFQRLCKVTGSSNADDSGSGILTLFNPSSTTFVKHFISNANGSNSTYSQREDVGGYFNSSSVINAIRFQMSSGNIDSGSIKLYGIKDS